MKYFLFLLLWCISCQSHTTRKEATLDTDSVAPQRVYGVVRRIYGKTSCTSGPNPIFWLHSGEPLAGKYFKIPWSIEGYPSIPIARHKVVLLVGNRLMENPLDMSMFGMDKCLLHINPFEQGSFTLAPSDDATSLFYYDVNNGSGHIHLVPDPASIGNSVFIQLVVSDWRGVSRTSFALEIAIGVK